MTDVTHPFTPDWKSGALEIKGRVEIDGRSEKNMGLMILVRKHFAFCLCAFLCCLAGSDVVQAALPKKLPHSKKLPQRQAGSNKLAHPAQNDSLWKPQNNSLPTQSGPGVYVCDPVTASTDLASSDFGAGCTLWLQMSVGGQPQLGKTPLWDVRSRIRLEMRRDDLQLSSDQAGNLAPILGVTHVVVGTLRGTEPHMILTYRLLQEPLGTPVGTAITLAGTREQIISGLPQAAQTLSTRLGVTSPSIPTSVQLSPANMQLLGQVDRQGSKVLPDNQQKSLMALASRNPLAGLMALSLGVYDTNAGFNTAVKALLAEAGSNTLVWSTIAVIKDLALLPFSAQLTDFAARCPSNYNLAVAETFRYRAVQERKAELSAAERTIKDAPHSPDGWLTYASTLSNMDDDIRHGRVYDALTPAEADALQHLYPQWQSATQRAVELDPAYGKAWLRLALAATFNGDASLADHALKTALVRDADKSDVYGWALEMYQPKWGGDPVMLTHIAQMAAMDTTLNAGEIVGLSEDFCSDDALQKKSMLSNFIARQRRYLVTHPRDGKGHADLAAVLDASDDTQAALAEYQIAVTLLPENAALRDSLGAILYHTGDAGYKAEMYRQAIAQFQEAVRIDLDMSSAYVDMGYCQKNLRQYAEAKLSFAAALNLDPASGYAYGGLAEVLLREKKPLEAIPNYQTAIRLGADSDANFVNLVSALGDTKQWDTLLATGEEALRTYPQGIPEVYNDMANAELEKKEWANSMKLSQAALALNPNDALAHENMAEAYLGAGRIAEAQSEWRKVVALKDKRLVSVAEDFLKKYP